MIVNMKATIRHFRTVGASFHFILYILRYNFGNY